MNRLMVGFLTLAGCAWAQDGRQIMQELQKRQHSTSMHYEATVQSCTTPKGCTLDSKYLVTKRWTYDRIGDFGNSKAIVRLIGPADVKGNALLIVNHPDKASDQWSWRPGGHEQKVQDQSARFFGTDFDFEDLGERDLDQYEYTVTGEVNGQWRIDAKAKKASEYTHSYFWVDKTNYTLTRIEAYSKKGLDKTIDYGDFEMVKGIWTPKLLAVLDVVRKTRTGVKLDKIDFNLPMKDADFTPEALGRE